MVVEGTFVENPAGRPGDRWADVVRRLLRPAAGQLDRLAPPGRPGREAVLPPEWIKYPPS